MAGRKPTHDLCIKSRDGKIKGKIGVGWANDDGSMSIALNACVVLSANADFMINLFPKNWAPNKRELISGIPENDDSVEAP